MSTDPIERWRRVAETIVALREQGADDRVVSAYRVRETRDDPMLFALVYLSRHLEDPESSAVTLSEVHVAWAESAKRWALDVGPMEDRRAEIAPREMGKSTWHFLILPMWVAEVGPARTGAVAYVNPAVAIAAGAIFLGETVTWWTAIGFVLVLGGSFLVTYRAKPLPLDSEGEPVLAES